MNLNVWRGIIRCIQLYKLRQLKLFVQAQSKMMHEQRKGYEATIAMCFDRCVCYVQRQNSTFTLQYLFRLRKCAIFVVCMIRVTEQRRKSGNSCIVGRMKDMREQQTEYWWFLKDDFVNSWWALTCQASQQPLALLFSPPHMSKLICELPLHLFTRFTVAPFFSD